MAEIAEKTKQMAPNTPMDVIKRSIETITKYNISGYAQIVAYNVLFATAPLLIVLTAGAAAITRAVNSDMENPAEPVLRWMQDTLPGETADFLKGPIESALSTSPQFVLSIGALLALWGAKGAVGALITGLNMAYRIGDDNRSWFRKTALSIGLTLLMVLLLAGAGLIFALGTNLGADVADAVGLGTVWNKVSYWIRWPLIIAVGVFAVMLLHRYGPAERVPFRWYLPGAIFTVIAGYLATLALGFWFSRSGGYSESYGIFGSMLAFIFWLYVIGFVVLLGGVLNSSLHTEMDVPEEKDGSERPESP